MAKGKILKHCFLLMGKIKYSKIAAIRSKPDEILSKLKKLYPLDISNPIGRAAHNAAIQLCPRPYHVTYEPKGDNKAISP